VTAAGLAGPAAGPLTLGTAGHIDHGKSALVRALTGVDTDRLPEERRRGISIALGYAPLTLPSGHRLSVVDVPGHERFVKTMVAGATGIDLYLMVVAADDGVMPQTAEHAAVLRALGVTSGVVAITKADLGDPAGAEAEARELLPDAAAFIHTSAVTGAGVSDVAAALDRVASALPTRAEAPGEPLLHIDRSFSVDGIGTVITGTLWSGTVSVGDQLTLSPGDRGVRIRGLQVHDEPVPHARAGQRVAVNLAGVRARDVSRGDVLAADGRVVETLVLDCALDLAADAQHGERVQVHHGTRDSPARLSKLTADLWQLRLAKPVFAADGDRVVIRRLSPPDTLGGGRILDAMARKHGRHHETMERLRARAAGRPDPEPEELFAPGLVHQTIEPPSLPTMRRVEEELEAAGLSLVNAATLEGEDARALTALREAGRAVRISGELYASSEVTTRAAHAIIDMIVMAGSVSLAEARDVLGTGRKSAQALLEYLDRERFTRRQPDDRRTLRPGATARMD
jgi:selenocysteine-specific elongation factor